MPVRTRSWAARRSHCGNPSLWANTANACGSSRPADNVSIDTDNVHPSRIGHWESSGKVGPDVVSLHEIVGCSGVIICNLHASGIARNHVAGARTIAPGCGIRPTDGNPSGPAIQIHSSIIANTHQSGRVRADIVPVHMIIKAYRPKFHTDAVPRNNISGRRVGAADGIAKRVIPKLNTPPVWNGDSATDIRANVIAGHGITSRGGSGN